MSSLISSVTRLPERWRAALPLGTWLGARPAHAVTAVAVGERCALARVERAEGPGGWRVTQAAEGSADALAGWRSQGWFDDSTPVLVLGAPDRHFLTLDRPPVPDEELALAVRYPLAEASDTEPEQLLTCAVPLPRINEALKPQVLAIAGRLDAAREHLAVLSAAGIKVRSIDVGYTALRGMALMQPEDSDEDEGWITVALIGNDICIGLIWHGEFCALRTLALPTRLPRDEAEFGEQLALHIQRTTDLFERQATQLSVRHVLVSLPALSRVAREAVYESLTLSPVPFEIESQIDMSDGAREVCLAHQELSTLVCVAAARLHDTPGGRAQVAAPVAEPEGAEA